MERKQKINCEIDSISDDLKAMARYLYENPETAMTERKGCAYIVAYLRKQGFQVEENYLGMETAFKAIKRSGKGPRLAFLAEYDALPEIGHACGHHMIAAMSCGAAVGLAEVLDTLGGEVAVFGTPAEETGEGKVFLTERGAFCGYDLALMLHPASVTTLCPKLIGIGGIDFHFTGKAAHAGSAPFDGINALDAVVLFYVGVSTLRQQLKDGTRIHGIVLKGGSAANVIPDQGTLRLEIRSEEQTYFDEVVQKVILCAKGAATATGCELSYDWFEPVCKGMKHNGVLRDVVKAVMAELGDCEDIPEDGGSSDVGNVSWELPTLEPQYRIFEKPCMAHNIAFAKNSMLPYGMERMVKGARILALTGLRFLEDSALVVAAWEDFRRKG